MCLMKIEHCCVFTCSRDWLGQCLRVQCGQALSFWVFVFVFLYFNGVARSRDDGTVEGSELARIWKETAVSSRRYNIGFVWRDCQKP
jgi:hypothetical protein